MKKIEQLTKYNNKLLLFLKKYVTEDDAKDIIQTAYLKILKLQNENKLHDNNLKSLLFTISKNEALSLKGKKTINELDFLSIYYEEISQLDENMNNILKMINNSQDLNSLILKDQVNGMSIIELSKKYNLSESAIKGRLFKIKKKYEKLK